MLIVEDNESSFKISDDMRRRLSLLLHRETELLDRCEYEQWMELFTEDCLYWIPLSPRQQDGINQPSLFYEDRNAMRMRVQRLTHPQAHALANPVQTSHITGTAVIEAMDAAMDEVVITRRFAMREFHEDRERSFAGLFTYRVEIGAQPYRIRQKRVDLVNAAGVFESIQVFI